MSETVLAELDTYGVAADHLKTVAGDPPAGEPPSFGDDQADASMGAFSSSVGAFQAALSQGAATVSESVRTLGQNFHNSDS